MDLMTILIGIGLVATGALIGYPLGHLLGEREATCRFIGQPLRIFRTRRASRGEVTNLDVIG